MKHKTLIILLSVFLSSPSCIGQFQKGVSFYGFDINYNNSKTLYTYGSGQQAPGSIMAYSFSVAPAIGIFLSNKILVGASVNWSKSKSSNTVNQYSTGRNNHFTTFGPLFRYYKMLGKQAGFFLQGELTWGKGSVTYPQFNPQLGGYYYVTDDVSTFNTGIRPGVLLFLTKRLTLESTIGFLGYNKETADNDQWNLSVPNTTKSFSFSFSPSTINFGIRYYLIKQIAIEE